jgi:hypothetical protein
MAQQDAIQQLKTDELLTMVREGVPIAIAIQELQISAPEAYRILAQHDMLQKLRDERDQSLIKAYKAGTPVYTICGTHSISMFTLYRVLHKHEIPLRRSRDNEPANPNEEELLIVTLYQDNATLSSIRKRTKRSISYIYDVLDRNEIPRRRR